MKAIAKKSLCSAFCLLMLFNIFAFFPTQTNAEASSTASENSASSEAGSEAQPPAQAPPAQPGEGPYSPPFGIFSTGACIISEDASVAVYEKSADTPMVAASLVKLMTCLLTTEKVQDIDATIITAQPWVFDMLYGKNASHADIRPGESLTVRELLYAALLPSANEAALMLAGHISNGNVEEFVALMNARGKELGLASTTFMDPNGLSDANMISARDACILMQEFAKSDLLMEIASAPSFELPAKEKHSSAYFITGTNRMLAPNSPYYKVFKNITGTVQAGKTGSLGEWQNFVSIAKNDTQTYVCAVLNSPNEADALGEKLEPKQARPALYESAKLYDWAFSSLVVRPALDVAQPITEIRVRYSTDTASLKLLPNSSLSTVLPIDADDSAIEKTFSLPEFLPAPIKKGDEIGTVTLSLAGRVIGTSKLLASQDISRNNTLYVITNVKDFIASPIFRYIVLGVIVLASAYAGLVFYAHNKQKAKKQRQRTQKTKNSKQGPWRK